MLFSTRAEAGTQVLAAGGFAAFAALLLIPCTTESLRPPRTEAGDWEPYEHSVELVPKHRSHEGGSFPGQPKKSRVPEEDAIIDPLQAVRV